MQTTGIKTSPYIEILAETSLRDLGSKDIDLALVNLLSDKFNSLPERSGREDIRSNLKAMKRLLREVTMIKEILSANHEALVKIPELVDDVTL